MPSTKRLLLVAIPTVTLLTAFATFAFIAAQRDLNQAADRPTGQLPYTLSPFEPPSPSNGLPFEPVAPANPLTCGAFFNGDLYLAGLAGLSIYAPDGSLRRTLRTGLELPAAPIVRIVTAHLRTSFGSQLLLATAGAGLLLLAPNPQAPNALPTLHQLLPSAPDLRDLTALVPLPSGDLLLGTRKAGVLLFNGTTLAPVRFTAGMIDPAHLEVTSLAAPDSTSILIGTRNSGLFYLHGGTAEHVDTTTGLPDDRIESIAASQGKAFIGTPLGTAEFDLTAATASFRPVRILAPGIFAHSLALNPSASELTIGTLDQGIQQLPLDPHPGSYPRLRNAALPLPVGTSSAQRIDQFLAPPNQPRSLYALVDGTLLLRTPSGWNPALPAHPVTLTDRNISALAFDPTGRLYVGFFDHGLDILAPEYTTPIRHLEDDHLFCINRLALDPTRQTIAAATANGLVLFDAQASPRQVLTRHDGLISDHISDIAFTRTGTILATPAGLTFLTSTGPESLYAFQGLVNNHVYTLAAVPQTSNRSDRLLAGTLGGLSLLENHFVRHNFTATNSGLKHNWITALAPLPDGSTLLGTYGAGLLRLTADRDGTTRFTPVDLPAATPRDLVINPNAILAAPTHIYAGTLDHGLLVYTNATARWSTVTQGLPSLNVTAFATRDGILYIGTDNGLVRIPEARLP